MADDKRSAILKLEIDQQDGVSELARLKDVIVGLKKEKSELDTAFRKGNITQKEYASELVRVETLLKKNTSTYNEQQRSITGVKNVLTELTKSNKLLADELKNKDGISAMGIQSGQAAKQMSIAGASITSLTEKVTSFINPATAVAGAVGLFTAALLRNEEVQKVFRQASEESSAILDQLTTDFVDSSQAVTSQDSAFGKLIKTLFLGNPVILASIANIKTLDAITGGYISRLQQRGKEVAANKELLRQLDISAKFAEQFAKDDERRAELQRRIRDDETKTIAERIEATETITSVMERSKERTIAVLEAQIRSIRESTINYEHNRDAQLKVAELSAQIADKEEEITGKLTENVEKRRQLLALSRDLAASQNTELAGGTKGSAVKDSVSAVTTPDDGFSAQTDLETYKTLTQIVEKLDKERTKKAKKQAAERYENQKLFSELTRDTELAALSEVIGASAMLFEQQSTAYKVLASAQTLISTYSSAQKSYDSLAGIPIAGPALGAIAAAAAVAAGLARVAQINNVQFAEGGYTGDGGKYDVAGVVHRGEYVVPKHLVQNPMYQGQIASLEKARLRGYADGGFAVNTMVNQNAGTHMMAQMMERIERLEISVSVREVTRAQNRVKAREVRKKL